MRRAGHFPVLEYNLPTFTPLRDMAALSEMLQQQVARYYGTRASELASGLSPDLYYFTPARDSIQIVRAQVPVTDLQVYRWDTLRHSLDHYIQQHGWTPIWDTYRAERIDRWEHVLGEVAAYRS